MTVPGLSQIDFADRRATREFVLGGDERFTAQPSTSPECWWIHSHSTHRRCQLFGRSDGTWLAFDSLEREHVAATAYEAVARALA